MSLSKPLKVKGQMSDRWRQGNWMLICIHYIICELVLCQSDSDKMSELWGKSNRQNVLWSDRWKV